MTLIDNLPGWSELTLEQERADEGVAPMPGPGSDGRQQLVWMEFAEVGGGSTAWINLLIALDSADTECTPNSEAYWDWAWNMYQLAMSEVGPEGSEARRLAVAYNLDEMDTCAWCQVPAVSGNMRLFEKSDGEMALYHLGCLAETLREQGL